MSLDVGPRWGPGTPEVRVLPLTRGSSPTSPRRIVRASSFGTSFGRTMALVRRPEEAHFDGDRHSTRQCLAEALTKINANAGRRLCRAHIVVMVAVLCYRHGRRTMPSSYVRPLVGRIGYGQFGRVAVRYQGE
jgi:hypothetical protein